VPGSKTSVTLDPTGRGLKSFCHPELVEGRQKRFTATAKNLRNIQNGHPVKEGIPPYCVYYHSSCYIPIKDILSNSLKGYMFNI